MPPDPYNAIDTGYLFNKTDTNVDNIPYKVDTYIIGLTDTDTNNIDDIFNRAEYFTVPTNVSFSYENSANIDSVIGGKIKRQVFDALGVGNTLSVGVGTSTCGGGGGGGNVPSVITSNNLTSKTMAKNNDVSIKYSNLMGISADQAFNILKNINENLPFSYTNITHQNWNDNLGTIMKIIADFLVRNLHDKMTTYANNIPIPPAPSATATDAVKKAYKDTKEATDMIKNALVNMSVVKSARKFEMLIYDLRTASQKTIKELIIDEMKSSTNSYKYNYAKTKMAAFTNRNNMMIGVTTNTTLTPNVNEIFYLKFRTHMLEYFQLDKRIIYEDDDATNYLMRKILVDIYIKAGYMLIHFDTMEMLNKHYNSVGDFVNSRFAVLAKTIFIVMILNYLIERANTSTSTPTNNPNIIAFLTNVQTYINKSNLGGNDIGAEIKKIMVSLQKMSNKVVNGSDTMNALGGAIKQNQLTMRTVIKANEQAKREVMWKYVEFYILFSIVIIVISSVSVLYFMKKEDIGLMVAAGVAAVVLVYKLILLIIGFLTKK